MITMRWFAYVLLLAVAFAIGLIGTISASRALQPTAREAAPVPTTPTVTTPASTHQPVEC